MKGRLITNGILSFLSIISFVLHRLGILKEDFTSLITLSASSAIWTILIIIWIISFVMGIVTLSMKKHSSARGLTIASGILALFGGAYGLNIIISFLAVIKIYNSDKDILINEENEENEEN